MATDNERVWELLGKLDYCTLVTQANGAMQGRPMSSIPVAEDGKIYFLTDRNGRIDDEIAAKSDVLLAYSDGGSKFVSVNGTARLVEDRETVKKLWNPGAQSFWPNGPSDPAVIAIVVEPQRADLWDGSNTVVASVKMALAAVTGSKPDVGERKRVAM
jgi:general stress protein 26